MPKVITQRMSNRIRNRGRGAVFTASDFTDLGAINSIGRVLQQFTRKGIIRRLCRGIYCYPIKSRFVAVVLPSPEAVAQAVTSSKNSKIQVSGAYAANLLGLSEQVPAKIIFLTSASGRTLMIGRQKIILKKTTPKMMEMAGRTSGLITQAFKYLNKESIDSKIIQNLKEKLTDNDKLQLKQDLGYPPKWIAEHFRKIIA